MDPIQGTTETSSTQPTDYAAGTAQPAQPGAILPEPLDGLALGDDAIATIVAMMARSFREDRKSAKRAAASEEKAIAEETNRRIEKMRAAADQARKAGIVSGVTTAMGGVLQGAGAGIALGGKPGAWVEAGSGASAATRGTGELFAEAHRSAEREHEAEAVGHEAAAGRAERRSQEAREEAEDAARLLDKVADFLRSARDSQNAASMAATRRA
jgi:hypothetical protein